MSFFVLLKSAETLRDGPLRRMRKTKKKFKPIMRHFVYCAALAAAVFFLAGCGGNPNKKNASETQTSETQSSVMEVDNLLADAEKLDRRQGDGRGRLHAYLPPRGRKIFLMGTDDTQVIRIEAGEKIGSFKPE